VVFSCREMANLLQRLRRRTGPKPDYIEDKLDEYIREEQVEETGGSNQVCLCLVVKL